MAAKNEGGRRVNNERLEYLGDAILDAVVGDIVFRHFPNKREGFLTTTRSRIVQRETLGEVARQLGLDKMVKHNDHMQSHNSYLAGNAFEAMVGAIYLDRGYDYCMRFIEDKILGKLINIDKIAFKDQNYKSKLLEWCQKHHARVEYVLLNETKDESGSPLFNSMVLINGRECGRGKGYSKKESHQKASKNVLHHLRHDRKLHDEILLASKAQEPKQ